jgi:hypothetical protein
MPNALRQMLRRLQASRPLRRRRYEASPVDRLETRILPTAIVAFTGATLTITGDTSDNQILVERVGTQLHVAGQAGTLINVAGTDFPDFFFNLTGAFSLNAKMNDGSDALTIAGGLQMKSVNIAMGDGVSNFVTIADATLSGKLTIDADNGIDAVAIVNTSVTSSTSIDTGWNSDVLSIVDSTFTGATTIKTDLGEDNLQILGGAASRTKFVGKLAITTGDDADFVTLNKIDSKAFSVDTGDGVDVAVLSDILVGGGITVKTGSSFDTVILTSVLQSVAGANLFDLGSDTDLMTMATCSFAGATTINLGSGAGNEATIDDVSFNNVFTLNTQGTNDVISVETNTTLLGQTTFSKAAKFNLGLANFVTFSVADAASSTRFLSSVTLTGKNPFSTLVVTVANTSFFSAPILTKVTRIDV